eukprot:2076033-Karenia_brevis.AAC.1
MKLQCSFDGSLRSDQGAVGWVIHAEQYQNVPRRIAQASLIDCLSISGQWGHCRDELIEFSPKMHLLRGRNSMPYQQLWNKTCRR